MYHLELKPMRRAASLWQENVFEREFDRVFQNFERSEPLLPAVEVVSTDKSYFVRLDVPGIKKEDLEIEVKEDQLIVSGERKKLVSEENEEYFRTERKYGKFTRTFSLPKQLKIEGIEASYENGVLEIVLPKEEKISTTKIKIQSRSQKDVESELKS